MRWHALLLAALATPVMAAPVTLPARAVHYRPEVHALARVESLAPLVLRASVAAQVATVHVVPGQTVAAGQPLVTLAGPQLGAELAAARARAQAAQSELAAAHRTEASAKRTFPVATDRKTLDAAESALAAARASLITAQAALTNLQAQQTLRSPTAARVESVEAAPGTSLPAGAPVLTLVPKASQWLRVEWFDAQVPAPNTTARFVPGNGESAVSVRLVAVLPARAPNSARILDFAPVGSSDWQAGETGELVWQGSPQSAVAVPAEALILDAGRWYVLADADGKLTAQAVTPGPTRGTNVLITHGLRPGVPVVVRQAYLLFHRDFAARYAPAD